MNPEITTQPVEFSLWGIYGQEKTIEAAVLLLVLLIIFLAGCRAHFKERKVGGFLWCLGCLSFLLFLHGVWRFGNEYFKFLEIFASAGGPTSAPHHIYHGMQLRIYAPLIVSSSLSAVGVFFTMILGILSSRKK